MDPPTYGRGSTGEMWKLEDHLWELLTECRAFTLGTVSLGSIAIHVAYLLAMTGAGLYAGARVYTRRLYA